MITLNDDKLQTKLEKCYGLVFPQLGVAWTKVQRIYLGLFNR